MKTKKFDEMEEEERAKAAFSTLYEGYVVDLIKALSKQVKFKYEMYIVADGNYGALNEQTGKWNGMIADLINHVSSVIEKVQDTPSNDNLLMNLMLQYERNILVTLFELWMILAIFDKEVIFYKRSCQRI